jgi:hypothetical protein
MSPLLGRPILAGQPWSQVLQLSGVDLTGMVLVVQFRPRAGAEKLVEVNEGAGISRLSADTIQISLTAAQTAKFTGSSIQFAVGRSDGGPREVSHILQWPVRPGFTR